MSNIFIGMLLVFLDFNLNVGNSTIGLIPDFIGYFIMTKGIIELSSESSNFSKVIPIAKGMIIYAGSIYLMDLLGISYSLGIITYILGLISTVASLYISYHVVIGIGDIERQTSKVLNAELLFRAWKVMAIFSVIMYLLIFIPLLAIFGVLTGLGVSIYYLVVFNRSKNLYYSE